MSDQQVCPLCGRMCDCHGDVGTTRVYGCEKCHVKKQIGGSGLFFEMSLLFTMKDGVAIDPVTEWPISNPRRN